MILEIPDNVPLTNGLILKMLFGEPDKEGKSNVLYKMRWGYKKKKYFWTHFDKEWLNAPYDPKETKRRMSIKTVIISEND